MKSIEKSHNHSHFWIQGCTLFESYKTIRGLRFRKIIEVIWPDCDKLSDEDFISICEIINAN